MSFKSMLPTVRAQEADELVDPQTVLREKCGQDKHCSEMREKLSACNDRVSSRSQTEELCVEELIDFMHCIDHCSSKTLFSLLK